jgi:hypothetical protein
LILLILLAFLFELFLLDPLHHPCLFLLAADLFGGLCTSDFLQDVTLLLSNKLFFETHLMLFPAHPFFMGDCSCTAVPDLGTLLDL